MAGCVRYRAICLFGKMVCFIDQNGFWPPIFEYLFPRSLQGGSITYQTRRDMPAHPLIKDGQDGTSFHLVIDQRLRDCHQRTRVKIRPTELPSRGGHCIQPNDWHTVRVL